MTTVMMTSIILRHLKKNCARQIKKKISFFFFFFFFFMFILTRRFHESLLQSFFFFLLILREYIVFFYNDLIWVSFFARICFLSLLDSFSNRFLSFSLKKLRRTLIKKKRKNSLFSILLSTHFQHSALDAASGTGFDSSGRGTRQCAAAVQQKETLCTASKL